MSDEQRQTWPVLKQVGRRAEGRTPLRRLEELSGFIYNMPTTPSEPENYFQFENLLVALAHAGVDFAQPKGGIFRDACWRRLSNSFG